MEEPKKIKCPKCGFKNYEGSKKCVKCGALYETETKSCPRCAKKNKLDATVCDSCGFKFTQKRRSIWFNIIFSVILVLCLCACVWLDKTGVVKRIGIGFRVVAVFIIVGLLYVTMTYGKKEQLTFDAEEEFQQKSPILNRMKAISIIAVIVGVIFVAAFVIYKYVLN